MGDALTRAGSAISNAKNSKAEAQLLDMQLKSAAADVAMKEAQANYYNSEARSNAVKTFPVNPNDFVAQSVTASALGRSNQDQSRKLDTGAGTLTVNRGDPVEKFENEFGEIISLPYGAWHFYNNVINPAGRLQDAVKWVKENWDSEANQPARLPDNYQRY